MNNGRLNTLHRNRYRFFANRSTALILAVVWLLVQGFLFYQNGIFTEIEASKYITEAHLLLDQGHLSSPNFWLYATQIFLIAAAIKLHTGFLAVVLVQLFFNAFATYCLYKLCRGLSNPTAAFLCAFLFIFNTPFQTFNSFLYTESLFYSFTIIFSCYLLQLQKLYFSAYIKIIFFLFLLCFTRPTGLLFVPGAFLYLFFRFFRSFSVLLKIGIVTVISVLFLFLLNMALGSGGELDFMLPFRDERIICGVPTLAGFRDIKTSSNPNSVFGLLYYVVHNPEQFLRLAWWRTKAFFGLIRPYYSKGHNLYLALYIFPLYGLIILSLKKWFKTNPYVLLYCLATIAVTWSSVILTCDDWHNRFFLSVVPYIYILILPALQKITGKIKTASAR